MKTFILLGLCLSAGLRLFGQDAREIVREMNEKYASVKSYTVETQYELFKGEDQDVVLEFYDGKIYKTEQGFYQKINQTEFIYAPDFFLQISSGENMILLESKKEYKFSPVDFDLAVKECSDVLTTLKDGNYVIEMYFSAVSQVPLSLLVLTIDKKTLLLESMDMYYSVSQDFAKKGEEQDLDQPHLRVSYDHFKANPKKEPAYFKLETYLEKQDKKYMPSGAYSNYKVTDNRKK